MSNSATAVVITVSLYPPDIAALQQISQDTNVQNVSATVRLVLAEYVRAHGTQIPPAALCPQAVGA